MEWVLLLNVVFVIFSWKVAQSCEQWGVSWWLNMFASALNGAIVLRYIL